MCSSTTAVSTLLVPTIYKRAAFTNSLPCVCSTSAHLAARMVYTAEFEFGDIEDRSVLDLGERVVTL